MTSGNQTCPVNITCNCDNEKDEKQSLDLKEALFAKQFQDTIFVEVFRKNDTNDNEISATPHLCDNSSKVYGSSYYHSADTVQNVIKPKISYACEQSLTIGLVGGVHVTS